MRTTLTILFIALSVTVSGQVWNPTAAYDFEGDLDDISTNNNVGTYSNFTFVSSIFDLSLYVSPGAEYYATLPVTTTDVFTISVWVKGNPIDKKCVLSSGVSGNFWALYINDYGTNNGKITFYTDEGGGQDAATTGEGYYNTSSNYLHNIIVTSDGTGAANIYVDGVNRTVDGTIRANFSGTTTITLGEDYSGSFSATLYIDDLRIYDKVLGESARDSLYERKYNQLAGYAPVSGRDVWPTIEGNRVIPSKNGIPLYFKRNSSINVIPDYEYLMSEYFEDIPSLKRDTIANRWNASGTWNEGSQSLYNWGGLWGNVWKSVYHAGYTSDADGFLIRTMFEQQYEELWMSYWVYAADVDWYNDADGKSAGKFLPGFSGGNDVEAGLDTTLQGMYSGWWFDGMWGGGGLFKYYAYHHYDYGIEFPVDGYPDQAYFGSGVGFSSMDDDFHNITVRVKNNDRGEANGILEYYFDGLLVAQHDSLYLRTFDQYNHLRNGISAGVLAWFYGGDMTCDRTSTVYIGGFDIYKINPGAEDYLSGKAPLGHTITPVKTNSTKYQNTIWKDSTYTAQIDTISTIPKHLYKLPIQIQKTVTKEIIGHSNPIHFKFTNFMDGSDQPPGGDSYWLVYSGTGTEKTLLWKFDGGEDGGIYPSGDYTIESTSASFVFYNGYDSVHNMEIPYW